jgi:dolichol-phosphate mannosyltransferase
MTRDTGTSGPLRSGDWSPDPIPSFAVVVPMFNEHANVRRCVTAIVHALARLPNRTALIVVNDGSQDGTGDALAAMRTDESPALEVVTHATNHGYGAALVSGTRHASALGFDYSLFMDSDLTNSPEDIPRFVEKMSEGVDVIKASRYAAGGRMAGVPWQRAAVSRVGNLIARRLYGLAVRDCTNGFRAVRTEILMQMELRERGFPVIMEELYWCRFVARSFAEVSVTLTNAARGSSFRYTPVVFFAYLRYPLRAFFGIAPDRTPSVSRSAE